MKTFQNRGEGFDVGEEFGTAFAFVSNAAKQSSEVFNRCHMRCDLIDDEISNLFFSEKRTADCSSRTMLQINLPNSSIAVT